MDNYMERFDSALEAAVNDWFRRQCADLHTYMYLYYKPEHNAYWLGPDALNEDWILATGETINRGHDVRQVFTWAKAILVKLPILVPE